MPAPIPPVLAPYLQSCVTESSLTLLTSLLDSPTNWLLLRFILTALYGVDDDRDTSICRPTEAISNASGSSVVFLSFVRSYEFWQELGKKIGLNFTSLLQNNQISYIDGLTVGLNVPQAEAVPVPTNIRKPKSYALQDIKLAITTARSLSQRRIAQNKGMLVIDGLDYVLASQPDIDITQLSSFIRTLQDEHSSVVLTASADVPLLHNVDATATPLEVEHSTFVRTIAHRSSWVFQLRQLETGHAKDVSGVIQISKGGANEADDSTLFESEWLYRAKGDGNVNVWRRGE